MILIYTKEKTTRLEYTFRLMFEEILQINVSFTTDPSVFSGSELPKINYSSKNSGIGLYMKPGDLLFLEGLICPEIRAVEFFGEKYFFETSGDSFLPFDPFAAAFYVVTRFEEYHEKDSDRYGRFIPGNSILSKNGLIRKPVVNIWAKLVADKLKENYPSLVIPAQKFSFISTIDIDSAWAYQNKGVIRNLGGFIRDILNARFREAVQRLMVNTGMKKDPFDTYDFLDYVFNGNEDKVIFFFLLGNHGKFDKNISHRNPKLQELIRRTASKYKTGIHPSLYGSLLDGSNWLKTEKYRLESITGNRITMSRQHFLYLVFPKTYNGLLENNITGDFTMGYSGECGFRAGICTPYTYYSLAEDKITGLTVFPFMVMDVSLRDYLGLNPEVAMSVIESLMKEVKKVNGTFISLWHNESLTDKGRWKGYREVFEKMNQTGFLWANE